MMMMIDDDDDDDDDDGGGGGGGGGGGDYDDDDDDDDDDDGDDDDDDDDDGDDDTKFPDLPLTQITPKANIARAYDHATTGNDQIYHVAVDKFVVSCACFARVTRYKHT